MEVARRVHDRALAWLRRHRYLDERHAEDRSNEPPEDTPIDAFARLALAGGTFVGRPFVPDERAGDEDLDRKEPCCMMATITEPGVVKKILAHLGMPTEPLPRARARDPTGQESLDEGAA